MSTSHFFHHRFETYEHTSLKANGEARLYRMSDTATNGETPSLKALTPPEPPRDIVQSALFLPISSISQEHRGRKIRTIGQYVYFVGHISHSVFSMLGTDRFRILAYDPKAAVLLLSAVPDRAIGPLSTLLVNASTPLSGMTPSMRDPAASEATTYSRDSFSSLPSSKGTGGRRENLLKLDRGEFVTVVGWLEGDGTKLVSRVSRQCQREGQPYADMPGKSWYGIFETFVDSTRGYTYCKFEMSTARRDLSRGFASVNGIAKRQHRGLHKSTSVSTLTDRKDGLQEIDGEMARSECPSSGMPTHMPSERCDFEASFLLDDGVHGDCHRTYSHHTR